MVGSAPGSRVTTGSLQLWIVTYPSSLPRALAAPSPANGKASSVRSGTPAQSPCPACSYYATMLGSGPHSHAIMIAWSSYALLRHAHGADRKPLRRLDP